MISLPALIESTESMGRLEKQYWLTELPHMTEEQLSKFTVILESERNALEELDKKFNKLPEDHLEEGCHILKELTD